MTREPSLVGVGLTTTVGVLGALSLLVGGVWFGVLGAAVLVGGVYRCSRRLLGVGVVLLFASVLVAGLVDVATPLVLGGVAGTVLAWDVGENTIGVAEQFPGDARTRRGELLHAVVSTVVVALFAAAILGVSTVSVGSYPLVAVALLIVGSLVVLIGLGR